MADARRAHFARLDEIMDLWQQGRISAQAKRDLIREENARYAAEGGDVKKRFTEQREYPDPDDSIVSVLSQSSGAPDQQVRIALETARTASRAYSYADTVGDGVAASRLGWAIAQQLLHGPGAAADDGDGDGPGRLAAAS